MDDLLIFLHPFFRITVVNCHFMWILAVKVVIACSDLVRRYLPGVFSGFTVVPPSLLPLEFLDGQRLRT